MKSFALDHGPWDFIIHHVLPNTQQPCVSVATTAASASLWLKATALLIHITTLRSMMNAKLSQQGFLPLPWQRAHWYESIDTQQPWKTRLTWKSTLVFARTWSGLTNQQASFFPWKFCVCSFIWLWFHIKILISLGMAAIWKKVSQKLSFKVNVKSFWKNALLWVAVVSKPLNPQKNKGVSVEW